MTYLLSAAIAIALVVVLALYWRERRLRQRTQLLKQILDLADALERELLECRARLREVPALATPLPGAGAMVSANVTLTAEPQVQEALRDLLAHRLWLRDHATQASLAQLTSARDALAGTRTALANQLERLADVRADLAQAREQARP
ncbi:hypothetical protein [Dokdonella sp.]|uniref:hypothetical protein n=1 Tax=Dokdonella sp. TaxID=2291710 RepID=UPI0031C0EE3D|nr:hypothetical protein [Dokdonella sp.]